MNGLICVFTLLLFGITFDCSANKLNKQVFNKACFNIKFIGDELDIDSIKVGFWNNFVNGQPGTSFDIKAVDKNQFYFTLSITGEFGALDIYSNETGYLFLRQIVEAGDSVVMIINYNSRYNYKAEFLGQGTEKYKFSQAFDLKSNEIALTKQGPFEINNSTDSLIFIANRLLDSYNNISKNAKDILELELIGHIRIRQLANLRFGFRKTDNLKQQYIAALADIEDKKTVGDDIAIDLISYVEYLYEKTKLELIFKLGDNELNSGKSFSVNDLYRLLKKKYTGILLEKLLVYCLTNYFEIDTFFYGFDSEHHTSCLKDAIEVVKNDNLLSILEKQLLAIGKGAEAFDFALPNEQGELINLHDLKGKIVLIDVWGNPCGGCLKFKKEFEKDVYPFLKDNINFCVVTINVNEDKDKWLSGIPVYSHEGFINLNTAGLGMNHPFIKHYNITGIPYLLLIDENNRVISSTVPFTGRSEDLLKLIQTYLDKIGSL